MAKKTGGKKTSSDVIFPKQYTLAPTETEAGVLWLNSLPEDVFRDDILEHLFRKMQKDGVLAWYDNIHGRNDKGVDFLLVYNSELGQRIIGVQAKSKELNRTGGAGNLSSLQVKQECEAAMRHEFDVQKNKSRLDNIELWCSSHITEDAEKEFNAPGDGIKIQVKKAQHIYTFIEKYCHDLLRKIPQCALAAYVKDKQVSAPKKLKLLGCDLHPKKHFLEPIFSKGLFGSANSIETKNRVIQKKSTKVALSDIIFSSEHSLVVSPELSGKTYLLEHVECLIADSQAIPIFLKKDAFTEGKPESINQLISKNLGFYNASDIPHLVENVRVFLLIDNIDRLTEDVRTFLFSQNPSRVKVLATSVRSFTVENIGVFQMAGVNLGSVTKFLKALDVGLSEDKVFTDRAHSFIGRTLATSGLPKCNLLIE